MDSETQERLARLERYSEEHQQRMEEIWRTQQVLAEILGLCQQSLLQHDQWMDDLRAVHQQISLTLKALQRARPTG